MRLICPGCEAQYEIDAELLPDTGRDVQCSACGHVWFQHPSQPSPSQAHSAAPVEEETPLGEEESAAPTPTPKREIDPGVLDVLREEAAFEADQREREAETLSSQPEFPLDPPQAPSPSVKRTPRPDPGTGNDDRSARASTAATTDRRPEPAPRSGLLPDIDSISSTLSPRAAGGDRPEKSDPDEASPEAGRGSFVRGFTLVIGVAILLLALYIGAEPLAEAVPGLAAQLESYVSLMDGALAWTADQVNAVVAMVSGD